MFYQTQIAQLQGGIAIDKQGKRLRFIGNLPCQVGDYVWTDGAVIFGHVPTRFTPSIPDIDGGIPILADNLRGYFTERGKFKNFNIVQDDWIVNSRKNFEHGADTFDSEKVIDAIADDSGNSLVVTGGIYNDRRPCIQTDAFSFTPYGLQLWEWVINYSDKYVNMSTSDSEPYEQLLGSDGFNNFSEPVRIFINGVQNKEINLIQYARDTENRALDCASVIMQKSYVVDVNDDTFWKKDPTKEYASKISPDSLLTPEQLSLLLSTRLTCRKELKMLAGYYALADEIKIPRILRSLPEEPFIAYTSAQVLTANTNNVGEFDGVIFVSTYGYCFPKIQPRFMLYWDSATEYITIKDSNGNFKEVVLNFFDRAGIEYKRGWRIFERKCVPFGFSAFYRIGDLTPVAFRDFGGINSDLLIIDEAFTSFYLQAGVGGIAPSGSIATVGKSRHVELLSGLIPKKIDDNFFLPVGTGFYKMDKFGRLSFYNSDKMKIADNVPVHKDFCHIEVKHGEYKFRYVPFYFNDKPYLRCSIYTSDGQVKEKAMIISPENNSGNYRDEQGNPIETILTEQGDPKKTLAPIDGYYIKTANGTFKPLQFTPLFYQFKNGSYLYGIRGGKLYFKHSDGTTEIVGNGVKNFRLNKLKNISKAKN